MTRRNDAYNHTNQSYNIDDDYSDEGIDPNNNEDISQDESEIRYRRGRQQNNQERYNQRGDTTNEQVSMQEETDHSHGGRDSPDFNRQYNNSNDTYDLTVSQTVISNQNATYRGVGEQAQNTKRGSTNRTFADSVLNHQYNQYTSSSNNNSHRNQLASHNQGTKSHISRTQKHKSRRRNNNYKGDEGTLISTDENFQEEDDEDEHSQENLIDEDDDEDMD